MRRHYTRILSNGGYKCVSCRQEFSTKGLFGKHCGLRGKCKSPWDLGLEVDLEQGPYFWTKAA